MRNSFLYILLRSTDGLNQFSRKKELDCILHHKRIDIAPITETHYTTRSHNHITDFTAYRINRSDKRAHGGAVQHFSLEVIPATILFIFYRVHSR